MREAEKTWSAGPGSRLSVRRSTAARASTLAFHAVVLFPALAVALAFAWLLGDLLLRGVEGFDLAFLLEEPRRAGRAGGIAPVVVSTALVLVVCFAAATPIAFGTAVLLSEIVGRGQRAGRIVRYSLDTLAGVPSVVFGLFGNAVFTTFMGLGYSILSGGLTLACMVLPFLVRSIEQALATVPAQVRRAAEAVALSRATVVSRILVPAAFPALVSGFLLGVGRAAGETAALLFTSGYALRMPESLSDGGRVISVHIYDLALNVAGGSANAYRSALALMLLLVFVNVLFFLLQHRVSGRRSRVSEVGHAL